MVNKNPLTSGGFTYLDHPFLHKSVDQILDHHVPLDQAQEQQRGKKMMIIS